MRGPRGRPGSSFATARTTSGGWSTGWRGRCWWWMRCSASAWRAPCRASGTRWWRPSTPPAGRCWRWTCPPACTRIRARSWARPCARTGRCRSPPRNGGTGWARVGSWPANCWRRPTSASRRTSSGRRSRRRRMNGTAARARRASSVEKRWPRRCRRRRAMRTRAISGMSGCWAAPGAIPARRGWRRPGRWPAARGWSASPARRRSGRWWRRVRWRRWRTWTRTRRGGMRTSSWPAPAGDGQDRRCWPRRWRSMRRWCWMPMR